MSTKKKLIRFALGSAIAAGLITTADKVLNKTSDINFSDCIYEINYPDGNGGTIKNQSKGYAETYFIDGVNQHKYYFIPLNKTDTIFFVGDGQNWNMKRISCN